MTMVPDWYVLSMEELLILAAGSGIHQFYGMETERVSQFTQEEYMQQIFAMTKKGLLRAEEDHVTVAEDYREIFRNIRDAGYLLLCYPGEESMPQRCFYCGRDVTVMESSAVDSKKIRITSIKKEEIAACIADETYFPDGVPASDAMFENAVLENAFDGYFPSVEQLMARKETWMVIDSLNPLTGEVHARLRITKNPFGYGMIYQEKKEESRYFQEKWLLTYLQRMTGGI